MVNGRVTEELIRVIDTLRRDGGELLDVLSEIGRQIEVELEGDAVSCNLRTETIARMRHILTIHRQYPPPAGEGGG